MGKEETLKEETLYEIICAFRDSVVKIIFTIFL